MLTEQSTFSKRSLRPEERKIKSLLKKLYGCGSLDYLQEGQLVPSHHADGFLLSRCVECCMLPHRAPALFVCAEGPGVGG